MKERSDWSLDRSPPDGDDSPPTGMNVPGDGDLEENSWSRSLMMLDGVNAGGSPSEGNFLTEGTSVGGASGLSIGRDSAGSRSLRSASNLDSSMMHVPVPSILSAVEPPTQGTRFHSDTLGASASLPSDTGTSQEAGALNQYLNNQNSQWQPQPQVQIPTHQQQQQQPQPNLSRSAYDQYFNALQANFRLAQAQAERELASPEVAQVSPMMSAVGQALSTGPTVVPGKRRRSPGNDERDAGHNTENKEAHQLSRNNREKNRAQKITDLIDQIRVNMEEDGRTLEVHSKFHVLSKCAVYLKEIVQATETKEQNVHELKNELKDLQRKLEEKKFPRADYDSVTSSLTSTSTHKADGVAGSKIKPQQGRKDDAGALKNPGGVAISVNASTSGGSGGGSGSGGGTSGESERVSDDTNTRGASTAKVTASGSDSSKNNLGLTSDSSKNDPSVLMGSSDGSGKNGDSTNVASVGKVTNSGGSDSSGNNADNADNGEAIFLMNDKNDSNSGGSSVTGSAEMEDSPTTSTFVSDAAVKSQKSSRVNSSSTSHNQGEKESTNSDLSSENKNPPMNEVVAFERTFALEYESVFLESSIPQIVSLPSGRIVAGNHTFLRMAGLRSAHVGRITLFSLVRPEYLSELFEVLSKVLGNPEFEDASEVSSSEEKEVEQSENKTEDSLDRKPAAPPPPPPTSTSDDDNSEEKDSPPKIKPAYQVMTLPCVEFPLKKRKQGHRAYSPLYVTITMLGDPDPQKRCIHSVFSDCRGTNGKVGVLTPALMEAIFSKPHQSDKAKRQDTTTPRHRSHGQHHHRGMEVSFHHKILPNTNRETTPVPSSTAMEVAAPTEDNQQ